MLPPTTTAPASSPINADHPGRHQAPVRAVRRTARHRTAGLARRARLRRRHARRRHRADPPGRPRVRPDTGRFISVDPVIDASDPQQLNGYAYANNSPETFSDPDGQWFGSSLWKRAQGQRRHCSGVPCLDEVEGQSRRVARLARQEGRGGAKAALKKAKQLHRNTRRRAKKIVHRAHERVNRVKATYRTFKRWSNAPRRHGQGRQGGRKAENTRRPTTGPRQHRQQIYTIAKIVVGVAALFACTICAFAGYAALAFAALDTGAAGVKFAKDPTGQNAASLGFNVLGFATFGVSSKYQTALQSSRQLVKSTQAITGTASRANEAMGPAMAGLDHAKAAAEKARVVTGGYELAHFGVNTIEDIKGSFNLRQLVSH